MFCLLSICFNSVYSQENKKLSLKFNPVFFNSGFSFDSTYLTSNIDSLKITEFKFYISNINIKFEDDSEFSYTNEYYLLDWENPESFLILLNRPILKKIKSIRFNLGVDSLTSVSGALGGDLDPAKGMYWAWQSGYINMKITGNSKSCLTRNHQFNFHFGGYLSPFYALTNVELLLNNQINDKIVVNIDLAKFFNSINLKEINNVMIPCAESVSLSKQASKMFSIK